MFFQHVCCFCHQFFIGTGSGIKSGQDGRMKLRPTEAKTGEEVTLIFHATIDNNWYLFSSEFPCEEGPIKTNFSFKPDKCYEMIGGIVAINPMDKHDKIFECDVKIFKGTAEFRQKIKVLSHSIKNIRKLRVSGLYRTDGPMCAWGGRIFIRQDKSNGSIKVSKLQDPIERN